MKGQQQFENDISKSKEQWGKNRSMNGDYEWMRESGKRTLADKLISLRFRQLTVSWADAST